MYCSEFYVLLFNNNTIASHKQLHHINNGKATSDEKKIDYCPPVAVPTQTKDINEILTPENGGVHQILCQLVEQFLS